MRTAQDIMEEYEKGDFYKRLTLYLEHRELRPQFMQIDLDKVDLPRAEVPVKKASRMRVAVDWIRGSWGFGCSFRENG